MYVNNFNTLGNHFCILSQLLFIRTNPKLKKNLVDEKILIATIRFTF